MSAETSTRSGEQVTGTAGALDVILQRVRAVAARVTRRIPKPILIAAVSAVLLLSVVVTMINSADPISTIILLIAFFLSIVQGLILVRTRTLSVRTLMVIAAVGISAVSTAVVITTSGLAALFDYAVLRGPFPSIDPWVSGFWTPIVEEFFKLLPLLVILAWSQRARTMTVGDCVLVGLMSGIGFALIEEIARSGAQSCDYLPGILMFPTGIAPCGSLEWSFTHATATAIIAAAVGLWWRAHRRREHAMLFGVLSWLTGAWIVIGHMAINMQESRQGGIGDPWEPLIEAAGVTEAIPYLFLVTLVIAVAVDYRDLAATGATPWILLPSLAGTTWRERLASFRDQRWRRLARVRAAYRVEGSADVWTHRQLMRLGLLGLPILLLAGWISLRAPGADAACLLCSWDPGDALPGVAGGAAGGAAAAAGGGSKPPAGEEKGKEKPKEKGKGKPKEKEKEKEKPKEKEKEKPKEEPKEKPKEEPREKPKPKEEPREKPKPREEPKEKPKPKEQPKEEPKEQAREKPRNEFRSDGEHVEQDGDAMHRESTPSGTRSTFDDDGDGLPDRLVVDEGGGERHEQIEDRENDTRITVHDDDGDRRPDRVRWEGEDGQHTTILDDDGDGVPDRTRVIQHRDGTSTVYYDDDLDGDIDRSSQYGPDGEPVEPDDDEN